MSIKVSQLRDFIVGPTLEFLAPLIPYSLDAEELGLGIAATETHLGSFIDQVTAGEDRPGPAYSIYQIEKATHDDAKANFLRFRPELAERVRQLNVPGMDDVSELVGNLYYATAMMRVILYRIPERLPTAGNVSGQAKYWKRYWNTERGAGTEQQYVENYRRYVAK